MNAPPAVIGPSAVIGHEYLSGIPPQPSYRTTTHRKLSDQPIQSDPRKLSDVMCYQTMFLHDMQGMVIGLNFFLFVSCILADCILQLECRGNDNKKGKDDELSDFEASSRERNIGRCGLGIERSDKRPVRCGCNRCARCDKRNSPKLESVQRSV